MSLRVFFFGSGVLLSQARSSSGPLDEVAAMRHSTVVMRDEVSKVASFSWRRGTGIAMRKSKASLTF